MAPREEVQASIAQYLTLKNLPPSPAWIQTFMTSIRLETPVVALQKTALFRIASADLTTAVQCPSQVNGLPSDISTPDISERRLSGPITVQVLDIEDIGHSRWSQVETLEAIERGEMTKGREIIRVVDDENNTDPNHTPTQANNIVSSGPHKLLVQDAKGTKAYAFELEAITGISVQQLCIGAKLILRSVLVARGVIMLEPKCVEVLGGKVDAWDRKWRAERKENLKCKAGMADGAPT